MANILKTHPSDWKYVSEGGATIVLSYIGPSRFPFDGKVLRLRKSKRQHSEVVDQLLPFRDSRLDEEPDDPTVDFQLKCMARLIPPEHLPKLETILLDGHWLEELALLQDPHRPQSRREEDGIDLTRKKGVLATDLIGGNELSVEIKVLIEGYSLSPPLTILRRFSQSGRSYPTPRIFRWILVP